MEKRMPITRKVQAFRTSDIVTYESNQVMSLEHKGIKIY